MKVPNITKKYKDYDRKSIALIGHMGSGKTLIGKMIAKKLKIPHIDTDKLIIKETDKTIKQIFENEGEIKFRKIEEKLILELKTDSKFVLSLGGGSILNKNIRNFLNKKFITLFLDVDISELSKRLKKKKKRPLLENVNIKDKIKELDIVRRKYYLLADIQIENCGNPIDAFALFLEKYNNLNETNHKN
jgi:shikimate kinase